MGRMAIKISYTLSAVRTSRPRAPGTGALNAQLYPPAASYIDNAAML